MSILVLFLRLPFFSSNSSCTSMEQEVTTDTDSNHGTYPQSQLRRSTRLMVKQLSGGIESAKVSSEYFRRKGSATTARKVRNLAGKRESR